MPMVWSDGTLSRMAVNRDAADREASVAADVRLQRAGTPIAARHGRTGRRGHVPHLPSPVHQLAIAASGIDVHGAVATGLPNWLHAAWIAVSSERRRRGR